MSISMRYCNRNEDAVEIVNDGFLKIFNSLHSFQATNENYEASLIAWIKKIMINTSIDHYRKNYKNHFFPDNNEERNKLFVDDETIIDRLSYKEIILIVQRLSPAYRTVFNLYVIEGLTHDEIAQLLNISFLKIVGGVFPKMPGLLP